MLIRSRRAWLWKDMRLPRRWFWSGRGRCGWLLWPWVRFRPLYSRRMYRWKFEVLLVHGDITIGVISHLFSREDVHFQITAFLGARIGHHFFHTFAHSVNETADAECFHVAPREQVSNLLKINKLKTFFLYTPTYLVTFWSHFSILAFSLIVTQWVVVTAIGQD